MLRSAGAKCMAAPDSACTARVSERVATKCGGGAGFAMGVAGADDETTEGLLACGGNDATVTVGCEAAGLAATGCAATGAGVIWVGLTSGLWGVCGGFCSAGSDPSAGAAV